MKLVQVTEQNEKYYSQDFVQGFNAGAKAQYEADSKEADKDPCEVCREQQILEWFARFGRRTLGQKDCSTCNIKRCDTISGKESD